MYKKLRTAVAALLTFASPVTAAELHLGELGFMTGCWRSAGKTDVQECFTSPRAGMMQGSNQTVENGKTTFYEFIVITEIDGKIAYTPFINGKRGPDFPLVKRGADEAVFENLANDFPKRIIYRKQGGALLARIEGSNANDSRNEEWLMKSLGP